jgi:predicted Zn-dependent protease
MDPLEPPESFLVRAAEGWLGLGNRAEAEAELRQLALASRSHPDVLNVRWQLSAADKRWEDALEISSSLIQADPESPLGWVHRSFSLHELKRTEEARDNLLRVVEKFPADPIMRYNLACYECRLGHLQKARAWLKKASAVGNADAIRRMALQDADLEPLWDELRI